MGLADFFRSLFSSGPPPIRRQVQVWLTQGAQLRSIVRDVQRALKENAAPFVIAHFPNTLQGTRTLLEGMQQPFEVLMRPDHPGDWTRQLLDAPTNRVFLAESKDVPDAEEAAEPVRDESKTVSIIAIECHPLSARDEAIERFAAQLPCRCRLQVHLSLDDAVMRTFAGEWVSDMLRNLGMKDDEAIESAMVMKRVRRAQRKIAGCQTGDAPAASADEWLRLNCPQFAPKT
jgi:hypothetical protein